MAFLHLPGLGQVYYHEYGAGAKPMLAFHGYGMTGRQFEVLQKSILTQYRVYSFDHFFHGQTKIENWTEQQILAGMPKAMMRAYLEEWFKAHGRQRISLMAYSIGANLALVLVEEFPEFIEEVILMAPDGLSVYKGFNFLMHHAAGKLMFKTVTKSNWLAPGVLKGLRRIRFIDESLYKIAYSEMDTPQKRQDVYYTLNLIKQLQPDVVKVTSQINAHNIKCHLIFGKHDMLFPKSSAAGFIQKLTNPVVHEVPLGHWLVTAQLDDYMVNYNL
ncbi:alpha/beta fold hydrolase [Mucilaginibacter terrae]|uniref:Pimeloyl-ACP methyl ester carboxylesterase n=1 Tax=Mucilaginibacter terrae TaxID=1955052 RepID=A0ABU3GWQ7_9SPHI|nr:alpha/beta fold hydrolase [Mucilaginibacter terrae]MDT3404192.1 pimeloyl-ACP methyl ester carboxylesterase [Mucilaginibacter terrae]